MYVSHLKHLNMYIHSEYIHQDVCSTNDKCVAHKPPMKGIIYKFPDCISEDWLLTWLSLAGQSGVCAEISPGREGAEPARSESPPQSGARLQRRSGAVRPPPHLHLHRADPRLPAALPPVRGEGGAGVREGRHLQAGPAVIRRCPGAGGLLHHPLCWYLREDRHENTDIWCAPTGGWSSR